MLNKLFAAFLFLLLLCFSARHLMFKNYLSFQKNRFRLELFKSNQADIFTIQMPAEKLFLNENGIAWEDKNKELVMNGLYHEVLHIQIKEGKAIISLIEDRFENNLIAKYYKSLSKEDTAYNLFAEFLQLKFITSTTDFDFSTYTQKVNHLTAYAASTTPSHFLKVFIPPKT